MKRRRLLIVSGLVLILLLLRISPAGARRMWIYAEGVEVFCTYEVGEAWVDGDMYYERGSRQTGFKIPFTDGDPFPYGVYDVEVILDLNIALGKGWGYGGATFVADNSPGYFDGWWSGPLYEYMPGVWLQIDIKGRSVGMDELAGWGVRSKSYAIDPTPYAGMCPEEADPFGVSMIHLFTIPQ